MTFNDWYETYDRDSGELMLFNTIDLEAAYTAGMEKLQNQLKILATAILSAHGCMLPGWEQEECLLDQGEICSICNDAATCPHHNTCQCEACQIAREVFA